MYFGPLKATSIDLCVHDFVSHSRYRDRTVVVCEALDEPFQDIQTAFFQRKYDASWRSGLKSILLQLEQLDPALIVVHQHVAIAHNIASAMRGVPVLVHRHNFLKAKKRWLKRKILVRRFQNLAEVIFVSEVCRSHFSATWPELNLPSHVVHNGLDFANWTPRKMREKTVLFAGRMRPSKGVLDLARALESILPDYPEWSCRFVCTGSDKLPDYATEVRATLGAIGPQAALLENQPFSVVKDLTERAAIAVAPSRDDDAFGRTAIEAFAGGAALVTSGAGGLTEVAGPDAVVEPDLSVSALGAALTRLMADERLRRDMSRRGRLRGQKLFDIRGVTAALDAIYAPFLE